MNPKKEAKFFKRFPTIFPNGRKADPKQSLICFGLAVNDGWYKLLWDLCEDLEKFDCNIVAEQVKEKFGGLRFYTGPIDERFSKAVYKRINRAEDKSYTVCETCGRPGKIRTDLGWYLTLCDTHYKKRRFKGDSK